MVREKSVKSRHFLWKNNIFVVYWNKVLHMEVFS